jgi:nitroimidazol reductase NimA-like FMN-containing flavoprotein (pyridoxamine 5'-phosphate oxidase superfamily)
MADTPPKTGMEMSDKAIRSLLESESHGVLSMGADDRGYGLPMSYSYDAENERVVFGFVNTSDSEKREFATRTEEATLTVYNYEDVDSWESVVVRGQLQEASEADVTEQVTPLFFLHEDEASNRRIVDLDEFEREWHELQIDDVTGRHSGWKARG